MTIEDFEKADSIMSDIHRLKRDIDKIKAILSLRPASWDMVVSYDTGCEIGIPHRGLLPGFLEEILKKDEEELKKLKDELDAI